jgi:hypothetical protein
MQAAGIAAIFYPTQEDLNPMVLHILAKKKKKKNNPNCPIYFND